LKLNVRRVLIAHSSVEAISVKSVISRLEKELVINAQIIGAYIDGSGVKRVKQHAAVAVPSFEVAFNPALLVTEAMLKLGFSEIG